MFRKRRQVDGLEAQVTLISLEKVRKQNIDMSFLREVVELPGAVVVVGGLVAEE